LFIVFYVRFVGTNIDDKSRLKQIFMQEKSLIKQNILQFIEFKGISKYKFYQTTGITRGILDQNNGMSEENTARFIAYFPEINSEWLLTGKGEMLKDHKVVAVAVPAVQPGVGIPLIPLDAMAGMATGELTILEADCERFVIPMFKGADYLIPVKGSSMYPKYSSGDVVACKILPLRDLFFQWNKVYVLDTAQGPVIKRIRPSNQENYIQLFSENPSYPPFDLSIKQINAIAIVIGVVRLE
jgi:repressor LexA